jgi:hypothetical protein
MSRLYKTFSTILETIPNHLHALLQKGGHVHCLVFLAEHVLGGSAIVMTRKDWTRWTPANYATCCGHFDTLDFILRNSNVEIDMNFFMSPDLERLKRYISKTCSSHIKSSTSLSHFQHGQVCLSP